MRKAPHKRGWSSDRAVQEHLGGGHGCAHDMCPLSGAHEWWPPNAPTNVPTDAPTTVPTTWRPHIYIYIYVYIYKNKK